MRKKIFGGFAVLVVAVVAAWNVNFSSQTKGMSDLAISNIEALAECEDGTIVGEEFVIITHCNRTTKPEDADNKKYCFTELQNNRCVISFGI